MNEKKLVDWLLCSSDKLNEGGEILSAQNLQPNNWYRTRVPSTVLASLVENEVYKDPYFGKNLNKIPAEQFKVSWWYRTEFNISTNEINDNILLVLNGINYKANIWLNGQLVADSKEIFGAFRIFELNITNNLNTGTNCIAIEVIPPKPGDFSIGFVDWNPSPPDNNLGIFRDVILTFNKGISIKKPFVESQLDTESLKNAELRISAYLENHGDKKITGSLSAKIDELLISQNVTVEGGEVKLVEFNVADFRELDIKNPRIWWPNNLGNPELYDIELTFKAEYGILDETRTTFGIRKIEDYINEGGHRGFKVNSHKVLIKGAGWTDDLFLQDTHESLEAQIDFVKDMNLNCIRLEGIWGKDHKLYDLCDQNGILMMVGWSCHWEHEQYLGKPVDERYGGIIEPDEIELVAKSWEDQLLWLILLINMIIRVHISIPLVGLGVNRALLQVRKS